MQTIRERRESKPQAITKNEPSRKGLIGGTILFDFFSSIVKREFKPASCPKHGLLGGCPARYSNNHLTKKNQNLYKVKKNQKRTGS